MSEAEIAIRDLQVDDLGRVAEIYNHYIRNTVITFDIEDLTVEDWQTKFDSIRARDFPFLAVEVEGGVIGFAYVSSWRTKAAYDLTVENTMYFAPEYTGKGYGPKLLQELLDRCQAVGLKQVVAVISDQQAEASIALHEKFGFANRGHLENVGYKFDQWLGVHMLQKAL